MAAGYHERLANGEPMDTEKNILSEDKGREQLISQIREAIPLETQAQEQMSEATSAMRH